MKVFTKGHRYLAAAATLGLYAVSVTATAAPVATPIGWDGNQSSLTLMTVSNTVTTTLFETTTLVTGTSMSLNDLQLTAPGTLIVKLQDLNWPGLLGTLSFSLTDATGVLKSFTLGAGATSGAWTYDVTSPQTLYGSIFTKPTSASKAGMYYANVSYQMAASPVPLPAAIWLLISGLTGLFAFRPKQQLSQT